MKIEILDHVQRAFAEGGATAALDRLIATLRAEREYAWLFNALMLKARHDLGIPLLDSPSVDLDEETQRRYQDAYVATCREVGELFLQASDIPQAWRYFRAIGEPQEVRQALAEAEPHENVDDLIDIAYHEGVHPRKGFEWILEHYGTCSAITYYGQFPAGAEGRHDCGMMLVKRLHGELLSRLKDDIQQREGVAPASDSIPELVRERDWLLEDNNYHVDPSHLSSVVQYSIELEDAEGLRLAADMTEYGERLSPMYRYEGHPPFQNLYEDYGTYLRALCGEAVEAGVEHFRRKLAESNPEEDGSGPAQTLVYLLARLKRFDEALDVALQHLADVSEDNLFCPSPVQLCLLTHNAQRLLSFARGRNNPLVFTAGLLMGAGKAV